MMQRIVLASRPSGEPTADNFRLESAEVPVPGPGQFLARVIYLSLDPYMRGRMSEGKSYADPVAIGAVMVGGTVAEVIASNHPGFAIGDVVSGFFGWTTHALSDGSGVGKIDPHAAPISTALGVLGMPGLTAFVGLNDIAAAQKGETIVVSAATGAVGSLVGQLARRKGMRVIGVAGGAEKCAQAVANYGYDLCLDHHANMASLTRQLAEAAPKGVDVYFENVGGKVLEAVLPQIKVQGRIAVCGMIAWYSGSDASLSAPTLWRTVLSQRLRVQGFIISDHWQRMPTFQAEVAPLVKSGSIAYRESVAEGLAAAPQAFISLLKGGNFGKQLVRIGADPG